MQSARVSHTHAQTCLLAGTNTMPSHLQQLLQWKCHVWRGAIGTPLCTCYRTALFTR